MTVRRLIGHWLAVGALFLQVLLSAGLVERPMAPMQFGEAGLVICTEQGMFTLPAGSGAPVHDPADRSAPPCPCCLSFTASATTILPTVAAILGPAWVDAPIPAVATAEALPPPPAPDPLQPRAPPVST
jgi:hypothetical protein